MGSTRERITFEPTKAAASRGRVERVAPRNLDESVEVLATRKMGEEQRILRFEEELVSSA